MDVVFRSCCDGVNKQVETGLVYGLAGSHVTWPTSTLDGCPVLLLKTEWAQTRVSTRQHRPVR